MKICIINKINIYIYINISYHVPGCWSHHFHLSCECRPPTIPQNFRMLTNMCHDGHNSHTPCLQLILKCSCHGTRALEAHHVHETLMVLWHPTKKKRAKCTIQMESKCMQMYPSASKCVQRKVLNYISREMVNVKPPKNSTWIIWKWCLFSKWTIHW